MDPKKLEFIEKYWAHRKVADVKHGLMALAIEIHAPAEAVIEHAHAYTDAMKEADIVAHELNEAFPHRTITSIDESVWTQLFQTVAMKLLQAAHPPLPLTEEEIAENRAASARFREERRRKRREEAASTASPPQEGPPTTATVPDPEAK